MKAGLSITLIPTPEERDSILKDAERRGIGLTDWVEEAVNERLSKLRTIKETNERDDSSRGRMHA